MFGCLAFYDTDIPCGTPGFGTYRFLSFSFRVPVKVCLRAVFGLVRVTNGRILQGVFRRFAAAPLLFLILLAKATPNSHR